ncbi:MAG: hypothetical protein LAT64_11295 [Phycisphaerales bacterium]|nr:hypothetical protein [Planctomycetota bacterium]MCH8509336.1 hypothetical protein [Phycisphaerales bacterium]
MTPDRHLIVILLIPLILLASCGREPPPAEPTPQPTTQPTPDPQQVEAAQRWVTYQYLIQEPERAPEMVHGLIAGGWHLVNPDANPLGVLSVFLGRLGAVHPDVLDAWTDAAAAAGTTDEVRFVIGYAVWDAEPARAGERLSRIAGALPPEEAEALLDMTEGEPPDLARLVPESPGVLDFWWSAFMADGDTRWVDLVLGVIPPPGMSFEESGLDDPQRLEIARAAVWSLASNAAQHPRVMDRIRERLAEADGDWPTIAEVVRMGEQEAAENPPQLP